MSQVASYASELPVADYAPPASFVEPLNRSLLQPFLLLVPVFISIGAWVSAIPMLTDLAWLVLAILCAIFLIQELGAFTVRFGIGGIILYGGVLIWFCYDYFTHWFGAYIPTWTNTVYSPDLIATSTMWHMIFITCMAFGIHIRLGQWLPRLMTKLPEPKSFKAYFWIILATQFVGFLPYALWNAEPFHLAIWHAIVAGRSGIIGAGWLYGRSGNVNYTFGAYIAQILEVGESGSLLAAFYAIFLTRSIVQRIVCLLIWTLWLLLGFGTGARGEVAFMMVPVLGFIFIKWHVEAADLMHRISIKAYIAIILIGFVAIVLIQVQIRFRNEGFINADLSSVDLSRLEGNSMFSEGLQGFRYIPTLHDFFYNTIPGEAIVLPIPNTIFWFCVSPLPRAFWNDKPIDPVWRWYNDVATGGSGLGGGKTEGTTISEGLVGNWYFRYGFPGVVEGGLLFGWLMGCSERALLNNRGRPMAVLFALGLGTWLFRSYRDLSYAELDVLLVGLGGISIVILIMRPFFSANVEPT